MALTVVTSGTTAALTVGGPETTLSTQTPGSPTTYVVRVDSVNLSGGEEVALRIYTKCLAGAAEELEEAVVLRWASGFLSFIPANLISRPCPTDISFRAALFQLNGTGRAFPWKLFSL